MSDLPVAHDDCTHLHLSTVAEAECSLCLYLKMEDRYGGALVALLEEELGND